MTYSSVCILCDVRIITYNKSALFYAKKLVYWGFEVDDDNVLLMVVVIRDYETSKRNMYIVYHVSVSYYTVITQKQAMICNAFSLHHTKI